MCGRFVQAEDPEVYVAAFGVDRFAGDLLARSYNVAPTDAVYAVAEHNGVRQLGSFRWGLVPWWAKDRKAAARHINARAETVPVSPAYRDSFATRRCLVPADGFYEWQVRPKGKLPHYIYRRDGQPLALAGLWARWRDPATGDALTTCTIVTTGPNETVAQIHDRMPVILSADVWTTWLDPAVTDTDGLRALLTPAPADLLTHHAVPTLVNNVANNLPECIAPLSTPAAGT